MSSERCVVVVIVTVTMVHLGFLLSQFLDAQRIHNLTDYLKVRERGTEVSGMEHVCSHPRPSTRKGLPTQTTPPSSSTATLNSETLTSWMPLLL